MVAVVNFVNKKQSASRFYIFSLIGHSLTASLKSELVMLEVPKCSSAGVHLEDHGPDFLHCS